MTDEDTLSIYDKLWNDEGSYYLAWGTKWNKNQLYYFISSWDIMNESYKGLMND